VPALDLAKHLGVEVVAVARRISHAGQRMHRQRSRIPR